MRKALVVSALLLSIAGCASTSVTRVGTAEYPALSASADVAVFSKEGDVQSRFAVVAMVHHHDPGKYEVLTLDDAIPELKEKARAVGANALIIDHYESVWSGVVSRGVDVEARAIRVEDERATPVAPAQRATDPTPRAAAAGDLTACGRTFERIDDLANAWVFEHPGRSPLADLPSRESFLHICGHLPDDAQICLNPVFEAGHRDQCAKTLRDLPTRDRALLDGPFLTASPALGSSPSKP